MQGIQRWVGREPYLNNLQVSCTKLCCTTKECGLGFLNPGCIHLGGNHASTMCLAAVSLVSDEISVIITITISKIIELYYTYFALDGGSASSGVNGHSSLSTEAIALLVVASGMLVAVSIALVLCYKNRRCHKCSR